MYRSSYRSRALEIIKEYFDDMMLNEQNVLGTNEACSKFLKLIPDEDLRQSVDKEFKIYKTSAERWRVFVELVAFKNKQVRINIIVLKATMAFIFSNLSFFVLFVHRLISKQK